MANFLFYGHDFKFLTPVIECVKAKKDVEVRVQLHRGHQLTSAEVAEAEKLNAWADIVFCEWALGNAVWFSQHKRPGQLLVVRMHFQEYHAGLPFLGEMNWRAIDALIVICPDAVKHMREHYPEQMGKVHYIPNPLDIPMRFSCARQIGAEMTLGYLGMVPWRKRPDLAYEITDGCRHRGLDVELHVKGKRPEDYPWMKGEKFAKENACYADFYKSIEDAKKKGVVVFDGFDPNPGRWYSERGFILSTSDYEGSHQAVAEGMAQGCIPVIRDWQGAADLYPREYVWHTVEEAKDIIARTLQTPHAYWAEVEKCRDFACRHFDARSLFLEYERIFSKHPNYTSIEKLHPRSSLRIGILAYIQPGTNNGYRVRVEQFIAQYRRLGLPVTLVCLHNGKCAPHEVKDHVEELRKLGCEVEAVAVSGFFDMELTDGQSKTLASQLKPVVEKHGLQWLQAEAGYCARVALVVKRACPRLKVSFDCHGVLPEEAVMGGSSPARVAALERMEFQILRQSDFVIFVAHAMQAHYIAKYGLLKDAMIVPCCIRENSIRESIKCQEVKCGLPEDGRPVLGYLGSMAVWQCSEEMVALFGELHRRYPEIFFAVFTPKADQPKAKTLFETYGIPSGSYTIAELAFEQVPSVLTRLNAGMMLRLDSAVNRVASPTKFGEMIAAGVPVVATDCIGDYSSDVTKNGFGVIVPLEEVESKTYSDETCRKIRELLLARRNGDSGFITRTSAYCRDNLFWDAHAERLTGRYWEVSNE